MRSTNPIESTFATVRHRTIRSKGCPSNETALATIFKLMSRAEKLALPRWPQPLPKLITGVKFADGIEVVALPATPHIKAAYPSGRQ